MPRIIHLINSCNPDETRLGVAPLLRRLSSDLTQRVIVIGPAPRDGQWLHDADVVRLSGMGGRAWLQAPLLQRALAEARADVIHAWHPHLARAAALAAPRCPVALSVQDPQVTPQDARVVMELAAANVALICSAAVVERRWVERGWARESATVIRGGIDFGAINRWRGQDEARAELGLTADHHLVAMPHFSGDRRGLADALVAIASAHQFVPGIRLAVHGGLRNSPAMLAFASGLPDPEAFIGTEIVVERLISMADVVLLPGHHEASSTTQAWAMAAGAAVLAAATYATSELVADGHNGRLVKPGQAMVLARKLVEVFEQRDRTRQLNEVARGQAFQAFGLTRYVEQTRHAYENLLTARPIGQDMKDAAVDQ